MILYVTLGLCALAAAAIVYRHDLYDREPVPLIVLTVLLGAVAMWLAGHVGTLTFETGHFVDAYAIAAIASLEEEALKLLVVVFVAVFARRAFNDPIDGLVYGSMSGLGMALEEALSYVSHQPHLAFLPPEELVRVSGHLVMGGVGGFGVGWAMLRMKNWRVTAAGCFLAAVALHFGWDWIALSATDNAQSTIGVWLSVFCMLAGLALYVSLTAIASERSRAVFAAGSPSRLWGWPFNR